MTFKMIAVLMLGISTATMTNQVNASFVSPITKTIAANKVSFSFHRRHEKQNNNFCYSRAGDSLFLFNPKNNNRDNNNDGVSRRKLVQSSHRKRTSLFSSLSSFSSQQPFKSGKISSSLQLKTLLRIGIPSILAGIVATHIFPMLSIQIASLLQSGSAGMVTTAATTTMTMNHPATAAAAANGVLYVLVTDAAAYVQNFLSVTGLLYGLILGETFAFVYAQQEAIYYALFTEVTETKSLVEQIALICQGRGLLYGKLLRTLQQYITTDLKQMTNIDPAIQISTRPIDDPLESIMYMTSVGVPSVVYKTVKSLRQARAARLGALQRKVPPMHMVLLWILAGMVLMAFPLLGAAMSLSTQHNPKLMTVEGCLFGIMVWSVVMTKRVTHELWKSKGGAYNVDAVLNIMVRGLEEELQKRIQMVTESSTTSQPPSPSQ